MKQGISGILAQRSRLDLNYLELLSLGKVDEEAEEEEGVEHIEDVDGDAVDIHVVDLELEQASTLVDEEQHILSDVVDLEFESSSDEEQVLENISGLPKRKRTLRVVIRSRAFI